jgi:hypothetical protein
LAPGPARCWCRGWYSRFQAGIGFCRFSQTPSKSRRHAKNRRSVQDRRAKTRTVLGAATAREPYSNSRRAVIRHNSKRLISTRQPVHCAFEILRRSKSEPVELDRLNSNATGQTECAKGEAHPAQPILRWYRSGDSFVTRRAPTRGQATTIPRPEERVRFCGVCFPRPQCLRSSW